MNRLDEVFAEFLKMRKTIKKPATEYAVKLLHNKLKKLAGDDCDLAVAIIEQSILNSWQDLYPLKQDNGSVTKFKPEREKRVEGVDALMQSILTVSKSANNEHC